MTGLGLALSGSLAWRKRPLLSQTFSPELNAAELTTLQNYSLDIGNGLTQTVQLERVDVYRLGEDRWLWAPPENEFWGIRRRLEGQLLSVRYPARDEAIVHRMASDLEAKLVQLCAMPDIGCPDDMRVRLTFSPEPDSLAQATFINALTLDRERPGEAILLPTPSLLGLPQDEVGYQAIFRGYASQFLLITLNDLTGWECCENVPFYRAAVSHQLYELGVGEWPLLNSAVSLPNNMSLLDGQTDWRANFPEMPTDFAQTPMPYVIIDFLSNELNFSSLQIATSLTAVENQQFSQWLAGLAGPDWPEAKLNQAFRDYMVKWQDESIAAVQPESGLMLLCQSTIGTESGFYYYDFSLEVPQLVHPVDDNYGAHFFTGLPDGSGVAAIGLVADRQPETYLLLRDGERIDVTWDNVEGVTSRPPVAIPTTTDPNGRYLLWTVTQGYATGTFYALTDLEACQSGSGCEAIPVGGYPVWSPDSEQLVSLTTTNPWWSEGLSNGLMLLRDEPTGEVINSPGFGSSIFWLDNEQFGYLIQFQNGQQQLVLADNDLARPEILTDNESLRLLFPERERPSSLRIQLAQPIPTNPDVYFILAQASLSPGSPAYMLLYDRVQDVITLLTPLGGTVASVGNGVRSSPDGRFLQITLAMEDAEGIQLYLQDSSSPRIYAARLLGDTPFPRHFYASWSADGDWLAVPELGAIRLWHNGWDERLLTFADLSCANAAWVNKIEQ